MLKMTDPKTGVTLEFSKNDTDLAGNKVPASRYTYSLIQNGKPMGRSVSAEQAAAMVSKARADGRAVIDGDL